MEDFIFHLLIIKLQQTLNLVLSFPIVHLNCQSETIDEDGGLWGWDPEVSHRNSFPILCEAQHRYGCQPKNRGKTHQNGWFIMENPMKMDDLGGNTPIFGNTHILVGLFFESVQQLSATTCQPLSHQTPTWGFCEYVVPFKQSTNKPWKQKNNHLMFKPLYKKFTKGVGLS